MSWDYVSLKVLVVWTYLSQKGHLRSRTCHLQSLLLSFTTTATAVSVWALRARQLPTQHSLDHFELTRVSLYWRGGFVKKAAFTTSSFSSLVNNKIQLLNFDSDSSHSQIEKLYRKNIWAQKWRQLRGSAASERSMQAGLPENRQQRLAGKRQGQNRAVMWLNKGGKSRITQSTIWQRTSTRLAERQGDG